MAYHPVYGFLYDRVCDQRDNGLTSVSLKSSSISFVAMESVMWLQLELAVTINCPAQQTPGHGLPSLPNRLSIVGL